jgi:hypothetical protein
MYSSMFEFSEDTFDGIPMCDMLESEAITETGYPIDEKNRVVNLVFSRFGEVYLSQCLNSRREPTCRKRLVAASISRYRRLLTGSRFYQPQRDRIDAG